MPYTFDHDLFKPIELSTTTDYTYYHSSNKLPEVKEVIFAPPATIVYWKDGSRTVVKCNDDDYFDEEVGFVLCFMKKIFGNKGNYNTYIRKNVKNAKRYVKRYYHAEPLIETPITNIVKTIKDAFKEKL